MKLKAWDKLILGFIAAASVLCFLLLPSNPQYVEVSVDGVSVYHGRPGQNKQLSLLDGRVLVSIENGKASILASDCKDQLCVHMGQATATHPVVCLPNRVVVSLTKGKEVDAVLG